MDRHISSDNFYGNEQSAGKTKMAGLYWCFLTFLCDVSSYWRMLPMTAFSSFVTCSYLSAADIFILGIYYTYRVN